MSDIDLDLSRIDSNDLEQLASRIEKFYKADSSSKTELAWHWERNHLMLDGKQWLVFEGDRERGGVWRKLKVSSKNEHIPRPVTNYIFDAYQTLKSYLIKSKPRITVTPNTQTYRDKSAAKLANLVAESNWERLKEQANYEYAAACLITYGTVFKKSYFDNSYLTVAKVPKMITVPKADPLTGEIIGQAELPETDPLTGEMVFEEIPIGDLNTDVVEPYRLALDPLANDIHKARWIMEYSIQTLDWIKETYSLQKEGYTELVDEVKAEAGLSSSLKRFFNLKNSSGQGASSTGFGSAPSDDMIENAAVVKEYYERPSFRFPKGRLVVVANNITLYVGDSPYSGPELGDWHPYSECRWEIVPGRFWGKSPFDDGVEIQKKINSIDAVIILTRKTMAIPQKLIPLGSGISPGQWSGRPGEEVFYRNSEGAPSTIPSSGVDASVFQEREQSLEDFKQITGAIDILKGDRPPGVTAASALNMLYEVGTGKLFPILDRWKLFVETDQKKQLKVIAKFYKEPREEFIKILKMKNSDLSEEMIDRFIGSELYDNCNVIIEAGSNIPKLQAAKQAMLMEAAKMGTLSLESPANRIEFNRQIGITGFDNDVGPDTKRAEWENDLLDNVMNSPDNKPIVLDIDNHDIHKEVHTRRMKEPSFMGLNIEIQQAYLMHISEHDEKVAEAQQQAEMQAAMSGMPPAPPGPTGMEPQPVNGVGKGMTSELKNAVLGDAITPGGTGV